MSHRKRTSFLDDFHETCLHIPWWAGLLLAAIGYIGLQYFIPAVVPNPTTFPFQPGAISRMMAIPVTGLLLLVWLIAKAGKLGRRRLLDTQSGIQSLRALSWSQFELLVAEAFRRQGYIVEERGGSAPDGGVDLILKRGGQQTLVQCKNWKTWKIGVAVVRELYGIMSAEHAHAGIVITTGRFTRDAKTWASGKLIRLIEGEELWPLVRDVQRAQKTTTDSDFIDDTALATNRPVFRPSGTPVTTALASPLCPACSQSMVIRTARRGPNSGKQFWGCPAYPACTGTRELV